MWRSYLPLHTLSYDKKTQNKKKNQQQQQKSFHLAASMSFNVSVFTLEPTQSPTFSCAFFTPFFSFSVSSTERKKVTKFSHCMILNKKQKNASF